MSRIAVSTAAVLGLLLSAGCTGQAEQDARKSVDLGAFATEVMVMKMDGDQTHLALWYPYEFYVESGVADGDQRAQAEKHMAFLKPYITIIVQCSTDKEDGTSIYVPEEQVRSRAVLMAGDGSQVLPLAKPPAMVSATVAAMKAVFAAEGDAGSANMHVLVFPNKGKDGKPLIDATVRGKLRLVLKADGNYKETEFVWNTPFDAMKSIPPCAKCKERVSAKWSFCPWCGEKLP